jgi:hypothetical protein
METTRALSGVLDDWSAHRMALFLLVPEGFDPARFENRLTAFLSKHFADLPESPQQIYLYPFLDFRLKSQHIASLMGSSSPASVTIMFSIGILLLLVVSINFINLATVRSMHRTREIGLRKVIGARRPQLILQFLGESTILSFIAIPFAIILYEIIHPLFYSAGFQFHLELSFSSQVLGGGGHPHRHLFRVIPGFFSFKLSAAACSERKLQAGQKKETGEQGHDRFPVHVVGHLYRLCCAAEVSDWASIGGRFRVQKG